MLNMLEDYIANSLPEKGKLITNQNLGRKVDQTCRFLHFYGNTVVFDLCDDTKLALQQIQTELYNKAGWMLSRKLDPGTFHMTLHDLINGPEYTGELREKMAVAETEAKKLLEQWKELPNLRMKATWLFNMVNTSIVLGLMPADEETGYALEEMYRALEAVVPLGYALTPHITMAYFRPGSYFPYEVSRLKQVLGPVELEVELQMKNLHYREFWDMNHYAERIPGSDYRGKGK